MLSHGTTDHDPEAAAAAQKVYRNTSNPVTPRTRDEVAALLGGLELVEPGLVDATERRPDDAGVTGHRGAYAAVAKVG